MKIIWLPGAIDDRYAIYDYLDKESPDAAIVVDNRILNAADQLVLFPQIGRTGRRKQTRELVVPQTPYLIAYIIKGETIEILRVIHGKQRWPSASQITNPARKM